MVAYVKGKIRELFGEEPMKSFTAIGMAMGGLFLGLQEAGVLPADTVQVLQEGVTKGGRAVQVIVEDTQAGIADYGIIGAIFVTVMGLRRKGQAAQDETKALRNEMIASGIITDSDGK